MATCADGLADLTPEQAFAGLHIVHCYLYGEVSIIISNRGLIQDKDAFRDTLLRERLRLTGLLVSS